MNNVENLKELRKKAGLTQMQLAAKLGVSLMSIRIWESGAGKPNIKYQIYGGLNERP